LLALEALQADAGDCLLLRFGRPDKPSLVVIDGGPTGVYQSSLKPRLEQLREPHGAGPLPVRLVMVSHIDDDHIRGILGLFGELVEQRETNADAWCEMEGLWHNSFGDLVGDRDSELADEIPAVGEDIAPASAAWMSTPLSATSSPPTGPTGRSPISAMGSPSRSSPRTRSGWAP
jgi:glyoxylase-like metal-dependent hydrolase (beta-lactamase superfamily II)